MPLWKEKQKQQQYWGQRLLDASPFPIWTEGKDGVIWRNKACLDQAKSFARDGIGACIKKPDINFNKKPTLIQTPDRVPPDWFDLHALGTPEMAAYFAIPVDEHVASNQKNQTFLRTLSETFAKIPIGIAIFGTDKSLQVFNPALSEMLGLKPSWLTKRPSLRGFIERLHDDGFLPEPKDFHTWRDVITEITSQPIPNYYQELWTLPNGTVLKVTGSPQYDGCVVFHFEDISPYIFVERTYRHEIQQLKAALDCTDQAMVQFDASGALINANNQYFKLWEIPETEELPGTAFDMTKLWQNKCQPTPVWGDFRDEFENTDTRTKWNATIRLKNRKPLNVTFTPIHGGSVLCEFRFLDLNDADLKESA